MNIVDPTLVDKKKATEALARRLSQAAKLLTKEIHPSTLYFHESCPTGHRKIKFKRHIHQNRFTLHNANIIAQMQSSHIVPLLQTVFAFSQHDNTDRKIKG